MLFGNTFYPIITKPTRITSHSATLIDHIYTNSQNFDLISGIWPLDISDHLPIFCIITQNMQSKKQNTQKYYRDYNNFDREKYLEMLRNVNWHNLMHDDVNTATLNIFDTINKIVDHCAPLKPLSKRKQKIKGKPWLTKSIIHSVKIKQKLYKTHVLDPTNNEKRLKYKKYSNLLNNIIKDRKRDYLTSQFEANKTNLKITWKLIGSIIQRKTKSQISPTKIISKNQEYTKSKDIANQLNDYFTNVGRELANNIEDTGEDVTKFIQNPLDFPTFSLEPVTSNEIKLRLEYLDIHKTSPDIPYYLIKIASEELAEPMTYIINNSINKGTVPDLLKISCITPIFKNGNKTDPANYRPISILPSFNKILERVIYDQLITFLDDHKILNNFQFGFRKKHSTEQAILEITDKLRKSIDSNEITCGLFLDFSKAFDTVDHQILLKKLYQYGIQGRAHAWFTSYLSNRFRQVKIDDVKSDLKNISYGVPQGSTLGPLLFLLYTNDLPNVSSKINFRMFADDTNIFFSHKDPAVVENVMNSELKRVLNYCATNKLSVNYKKTHYMIIKSNRKKINDIRLLQFEQKDHIKYLGIYIDHHLSWEKQIKFIQNKISKNIGIIRKLRHYVNLNTLRNLYYALIYPYLTYGILSWGSTYKTKLTKICTTQNKGIRNIFFANQQEHAAPLYSILDILTFENIFIFKAAIFCYKIINQEHDIPKIFSGIITLAKKQQSYNTRYASANNLVPPQVRTNYGKFMFQSTITKIWESIPITIKNSKTIALFKMNLKSHLILSQT